jgi:hypothetical protein
VSDGTLCFGFIFTPQGSGAGAKGTCAQVDIGIDPTQLHDGACITGIFDHGKKPAPQPPSKAPVGAKNVLFIVADDMRPSMGPYAIDGQPSLYHTPALDSLAATGITFTRAYVQISYCAPSRNSFMSGRRPDATKTYSFIGTYRNPSVGQDWVALPEHFVRRGYNVGGSGKLFHPNVPANFDQPWSWTIPYVEFGDNATNTCTETCCGLSDGTGTFGPGQEGARALLRLRAEGGHLPV